MICFSLFLRRWPGPEKNTLRSVPLMNREHSFVVVLRIEKREVKCGERIFLHFPIFRLVSFNGLQRTSLVFFLWITRLRNYRSGWRNSKTANWQASNAGIRTRHHLIRIWNNFSLKMREKKVIILLFWRNWLFANLQYLEFPPHFCECFSLSDFLEFIISGTCEFLSWFLFEVEESVRLFDRCFTFRLVGVD